MSPKTLDTETQTFEPDVIQRYYRLQRALTDPQTFEEFLVNPKEVAARYEITLTEQEIAATRNASHFLADWEFFCGDGQWLEAAPLDGRFRPAHTGAVAEILIRKVRERIAGEILCEIPEAIHRVVSQMGGATLFDPEESLDSFPEHVQPLARTLRKLMRTMTREITREVDGVLLQGILAHSRPVTGAPGTLPQETGAAARPVAPAAAYQVTPVENLGAALTHRLHEVVNRAVGEAVEKIRPATPRPFTPGSKRPRMEAHRA